MPPVGRAPVEVRPEAILTTDQGAADVGGREHAEAQCPEYSVASLGHWQAGTLSALLPRWSWEEDEEESVGGDRAGHRGA